MQGTRILVEMLLFFLVFFLPGYLTQASFGSGGAVTTAVMLQVLLTSIPQLLLMVYVVSPRALMGGPEGSAEGSRWGLVPLEPRDAIRVVLLVIACFAVFAPLAGLTLLLPRSLAGGFSRGFRWSLSSAAQIPLAVAFGIATGYREEFFFRSYLLQRFQELGLSSSMAVVISTALFCLGHFYEGILAIVTAAFLGVLFSVIYLRRRNLHVIALGHGLYNAAVLCLGFLASSALPGGTG